MSFAACCQNYDLIELQASRFSQPEHPHVSELLTQQPRAFLQSNLRNDEQQKSSGLEPAIGMFKENEFQPLVIAFPCFPVVRRVKVQ